ncbi:hypothetical protein, partial [uncultured Holdemanella sp.]|uniref:hypothetical protein n=1 Tax=uncultured Holdemanella sp. TaxID=1763549 RepID=UPI0025FCF0FB
MKVFSMSQRIYYKDLEPEAESIIKKDLELYNCMLHKAFKIRIKKIDKKIKKKENQLKKALKEKEKLINRSKKKKYTEEDYL